MVTPASPISDNPFDHANPPPGPRDAKGLGVSPLSAFRRPSDGVVRVDQSPRRPVDQSPRRPQPKFIIRIVDPSGEVFDQNGVRVLSTESAQNSSRNSGRSNTAVPPSPSSAAGKVSIREGTEGPSAESAQNTGGTSVPPSPSSAAGKVSFDPSGEAQSLTGSPNNTARTDRSSTYIVGQTSSNNSQPPALRDITVRSNQCCLSAVMTRIAKIAAYLICCRCCSRS